jgi:putative ABC transport system permease protein
MNSINLKLGVRNLLRDKQYTILNILGLSIGMASAMLIFLWVQFQVNFDRFHKNKELIYRVVQDQFYTNGEVFHVQVTPPGMVKALKDNVPGITHSSRYSDKRTLVQANDIKTIEHIHFVDPDFFTMFSFPLLRGNVKTVFKTSHSVVISEKMAGKFFGNNDPIGKTVMVEGKYPFMVTGIIKDCPQNTDISYNMLVPFEFYKELGEDIESLDNNWLTTYVQLSPGVKPEPVNQNIEKLKKKYKPHNKTIFYLQPLGDIHLHWIGGGGPIKNIKLFSIIAALLILIAAINFTNLSTAMAAKRFREIGVKKSFGASRKVLVTQFLSETLLLSFISLFIAFILTESFLPWYNSLLMADLGINYFDGKLMAGFLGIMFITGVLSGSYPALFLSGLKPVNILKANKPAHKQSFIRESLVILQFGLSIILIVNTIIIKKQQNFMQTKELGIRKDNILYIPIRGELGTKSDVFKSQLLKDPSIKSVCLSSSLPSGIWSNGGGYTWHGKPSDVDPLVSQVRVDFDFARTFGIKMYEGEFFPANQYMDTNHVVINKTFADIIAKKPIINEVIEIWGMKLKIVGVTENFHFKPLSSKIDPLAMFCKTRNQFYLFCKISSGNIRETIKKIKNLHDKMNSNYPFEYHFLDEAYDQLYTNEERQGKIFNVFSFLAIFISSLGLFGLSSFMMAQRIKEIGIRKANGGGIVNIMSLLTRYYIKWVIISFVIASPVSYYFIHAWLKNYAYRTPVSWWIFALAGLVTFIIALATVGVQCWKTANKNPVEALRYE